MNSLATLKLTIDQIDEDNPSKSPINLNISNMIPINLDFLLWYNYEIPPDKLKIVNTGKTLIVNGEWDIDRPYLTSGPFADDNYLFSQMHFHWGPNDITGSEHFVDGGSQSMELHAVHFKSEYQSHKHAISQVDGIIIVVYLLKLQTAPNLSFNDIVMSLSLVRQPHSTARIIPEPLIKILRPFIQDYFLYRGAIIEGGIRHWVKWLISREPIGISLEQTAGFRKLNNTRFKPNLNNCRSLSDEEKNSVYHINPSGSCYASLLPIPRDPAPLTANQRGFTIRD